MQYIPTDSTFRRFLSNQLRFISKFRVIYLFLSFDLVHISVTGRSAIVYFEQFQTLAPLVYYFNWRVGNSVERDLPSLLLGHPIFFQTQTKHTISQNHIRNTQPHTVVLRETDSFANFWNPSFSFSKKKPTAVFLKSLFLRDYEFCFFELILHKHTRFVLIIKTCHISPTSLLNWTTAACFFFYFSVLS